jgi:hypothetical protein
MQEQTPLQEEAMGLEIVEILMNVEDAFGFSISDEDAAGFATLGDVNECVLARRFRAKPDVCLNAIAFHKVRRALMSALRLPRDAVRVSTNLSDIIRRRRRKSWRAIGKASGLRLPILRRPRWVVTMAVLAALVLGAASSLLLGLKLFHGGVAVAILLAGVFGYALFWLTECLAYVFPPEVATVGQLAKAILARNYRPIVAESEKSATDAEVWDTLRRIIGEQTGVAPGKLTKQFKVSKNLIAA